MNKNNNQAWKTKYGPRRVPVEAPTLAEAIFAAQGLTDDAAEQTEIAAALMGLPPDKVLRSNARKHGLAIARDAPSRWCSPVRPARRAASWSSASSVRRGIESGRTAAADVVASAGLTGPSPTARAP